MKTLWIALALLATTVATRADDIGAETPNKGESLAVRAFVGAAFAENHCGYKANQEALIAYLQREHLDPKDIVIRFGHYASIFNSTATAEYDQRPAEFCSFLYDSFGENGRVPNLIQRR